MWSTQIKQLSFNGSVRVSMGSGSPALPLKGVLVDVYRFSLAGDGEVLTERLNQAAARTSVTGEFDFVDLPVSVETQWVIPGSPPYDPVEVVNLGSLPNLAFRIAVEADVLTGTAAQGTQFVEVYDERAVIDESWVTSHPERMHVALNGGPAIPILIPEGDEEATLLAGISIPAPPGTGFHFLRVGRAIRDEIGELGEARPDYVDYFGKAGYMISSNVRTVNGQPSFFGDQVDAPFGRTLQIGGHFGTDFLVPALTDNLYYTVSFWEYTGDPALAFDPAHLTNGSQILDPLFNKKYLLPTPALPKGKWETLNLGPFDGTITAVQPPHDPALVGTSIEVYKRPPLPNPLTEYWPFWDLMVIWNSATASNQLIILTLEAYQRTGGTDTNPKLTKLAMSSSPNDHLPLMIDNRIPVPKFLPYDPADTTERKFHTAYARFAPFEQVRYSPGSLFGPGGETSTPMGICNGMLVVLGQVDGNECILVRCSVEDGSGNAHPHIWSYELYAKYTPQAVSGAPDEDVISLKPSFSGHDDIDGKYTPVTPPIMEVDNKTSVLVPSDPDGWPPESGDPWAIGAGNTPCPQYAMEFTLRCTVRTVNGWSRLFGRRHVSRHIIIKR